MRKSILATALLASALGSSLSASAGTGQIGSGAVEVKSCAIHLADYAYSTPPAPILMLLNEKGYFPVTAPVQGSLTLDVDGEEVFAGYKYSKLGEQFLKNYAVIHSLNLYGEQNGGDFKTSVKHASVKQSTSDALSAQDKRYDEYLTLKPESFLSMIRQLPNCRNNILIPVSSQQQESSPREAWDWTKVP